MLSTIIRASVLSAMVLVSGVGFSSLYSAPTLSANQSQEVAIFGDGHRHHGHFQRGWHGHKGWGHHHHGWGHRHHHGWHHHHHHVAPWYYHNYYYH